MSIVTGQQIHLLGGPLFILFKVIGCHRLAKEQNTNAIYWLEMFDSDFPEINRIHYLNHDHQLKTLIWKQPNNTKGLSCGLVPIDDNLKIIFQTFFTDIKQTAHTSFLKNKIFSFLDSSENLSDLTLKIAEFIFHDGLDISKKELRLFNPFEKEFLDFSKPYLLNEIERTPTTLHNNQCNVFCLHKNKRQALFKKKDGVYNRSDEKISYTEEILLPNIKTRNLLQDSYFKTHTYVAGPSEYQYIFELKSQYHYHKINFPHIEKRMSATVIDLESSNILKKYNLNQEQLISNNEVEIINNFLLKKGFDEKQISHQLEKLKNQFIQNLQEYKIDTKQIEKIIYKELKNEIKKMKKIIKQNLKQPIEGIQKIHNKLSPFDKKQERVLNLFYYLNLYGMDFLKTIYKEYNQDKKIIKLY